MTETLFKLEDSPVSSVKSIGKGQHLKKKILEMNNQGLIHFSAKQIYERNFVFIFLKVLF